MKSNLFTRFLQRGRDLFGGRRRRQMQPRSPSLPRLEMLEERQLLSASFGGFNYFAHFAPITVEIVIQEAALSQTSTLVALGQNSGQAMSSFFGQGNQAAPTSGMNANPSSVASDNVVPSPAAADESMSRGSPQPVETTTPVVEHVSVLPVLSLPLVNPQANLQPGVSLTNTPTLPVNAAANTTRTSASISLYSAGTSLDPMAVTNPDTPPSSENPAAPVDTLPAVPPALPEPAPTMPVVPPGATSVSPTKVDVDTHVFAQFASFDHSPALNLPAEMFVVPARAQHNAAPLQSPVNESAALVSAPDALLAQVTLGAAQEATDVARERLTPVSERWAQFVAPLFVMAGTYWRGQTSQRTKLKERSRPAQLPKR
jgi:hypothetical protein